MRQVLFLGNCQAASLAGVYRDHIAPETGDGVSYLPTAWPLSDAEAELVKAADVIVDQVFDFKQTIALADLAHGGRVVRFPTVSGAFLWPFTGRAHPANASFYFCNDGPYPPETGDRYLNTMIAEGVEPDEAVARYLDLDLAAILDLDKRYAAVIRQQRRRDALADWQIADLIENHFQDEHVFFSPYHPGSRLFGLLMTELLGRIGVDPGILGRAQRVLQRSPLDDTWLPIHPAVARHFGLTYIAEDQRYRSLEGRFTFAEWAKRYMRFEWNAALLEGAFFAHDPAAGVEKLQIGLLQAPDSARGHGKLAEFLYRLDRFEYAAAALNRAIELDPDEPRFRSSLGHVLARLADPEAAARAFHQALEFDPDDPGMHTSLSHALCALERFEEAIEPARRALELDPAHASAAHLGNLYARCGYLPEAELAYREALAREPDSAAVHGALGRVLADQGHSDEAVAQLRHALVLDPENPDLAALLADLLAEQEAGAAHADEPSAESMAVGGSAVAEEPDLAVAAAGDVDLGAIPPMEPEAPPPRTYAFAEDLIPPQPDRHDHHRSGDDGPGDDGPGDDRSGRGRSSLRLLPVLGSALERARSAVARVGGRASPR